MSPGLDSILTGSPCREGGTKKGRACTKTDEIIIRCDYAQDSRDDSGNAEGDDLIWWSWDGKIAGFSD